MARAELNRTFFIEDGTNLQSKLDSFFILHKMKVCERNNDFLLVTQGSQLYTRLLGGWFVSPINYPKKASLKITKKNNSVLLDVHIEETLGFGFLDQTFKNKYLGYFEIWMQYLHEAIK